MLSHQLPALPVLETFWNALPEFFAWLAGGMRSAAPQSYPLAPGEEILRQPVGTLGPGIVSSALEIIRFAAVNQLIVEIDYVKEDGERTTRQIEAYSLRRAGSGAVLLHVHDLFRNEHRSYRVERIRAARATQRTFTPRHAIELTPSGAQAIPLAARTRAGGFGGAYGWGRASSPTYVYQCPVCRKMFARKNRNSALRPHKDPTGWDCPGRMAYLIETR
jgi:WYL domain-containing protein